MALGTGWGHGVTLVTLVAAAGYQHIRMYDLNSNNPNPVINYDGVSKNITSVGFHEDGRWMYTGGEDCMARIWDLRWAEAAAAPQRWWSWSPVLHPHSSLTGLGTSSVSGFSR